MEIKEMVIAKYGEIILKGGNRPRFESILINNINNSLKKVAKVHVKIMQATVYVDVEDPEKLDVVLERMGRIFGIIAITKAAVCKKDRGNKGDSKGVFQERPHRGSALQGRGKALGQGVPLYLADDPAGGGRLP